MRLRTWLIYEKIQQKFLTSSFSYRVLNNSDWHIRSFWYQQQQRTHQKDQPLAYSRILHSAQVQQIENDKHMHREDFSVHKSTKIHDKGNPSTGEWMNELFISTFQLFFHFDLTLTDIRSISIHVVVISKIIEPNSMNSYRKNNLRMWIICEHWFPQWKIPMLPFTFVSTLKIP